MQAIHPPAIVAQAQDVLASCAVNINRALDGEAAMRESIVATEAKALQFALEAGRQLLVARDHVPAGGWDAWRKKHLKCSVSTAQQRERIALEWERLAPLVESGEVVSVRDALAKLRPATPAKVAATDDSPQENNLPQREFSGSTLPTATGNLQEEEEIPAPSPPPPRPEKSTEREGQGTTPTVRPLSAVEAPERIARVQPAPAAQSDQVGELLAKVKALEAEKAALRVERDEAKVELLRTKDALARANREAEATTAMLSADLEAAQKEIAELKEKAAAGKGKREPVTLPIAPPGFVACRTCASLVAIPEKEAPTPMPGTLEAIRNGVSAASANAGEEIALYYEKVVESGIPPLNAARVIRERLLQYTKEQLCRMADGYIAHCRKHGHTKKESAAKFYSLEGHHLDFKDYQPPPPKKQTPIRAPRRDDPR